MKVLIVNKFLYPRGGDCIHSLNLGEVVRHAGHDVRFYAMDYPQNIACEESRYFAEEISFSAPGLQERIKAACRILWGSGVAESFNRILDEFRPDVVHLNNIHSYLSPVVARLAHQRGIKVLWTLHDYKLICPSYSCLCQGEPCEACFVDKKKVVSRRCMKNSLLASLLAFGEAVNWNRDKLSAWTDCFVCPSRFMAEKMRQGGFPVHKLQVVANFIGTEQAQCIADTPDCVREEAYAYIGRLSPEKGIESLLEAATRLPYTLYIAGSGPLEADLRKRYAADNICFLGHLDTKSIIGLQKRVLFTVIPSVCYENNPISVIESLCCGTPVLGRDIGGIPELLETDNANRLFSRNEELPASITGMFQNATSVNRRGLSAAALQRFSARCYYQKWREIAEEE